MVTIGLYQSLSNSAMKEHICLEYINKLYISAGKCDYQQQNKAIIEAEMLSTPERSTDNSPVSPGPSVTFRNPSEIKPLHVFTEVLDVKKKTSVCRVVDDKSKRKSIRAGSVFCSSIP